MNKLDANAHFDYNGSRLAHEPAPARFASRMSLTASGDEMVVKLAGRSLSIRSEDHGLKLGSDVIDLSGDPQETLERMARRLGIRPTQMDG